MLPSELIAPSLGRALVAHWGEGLLDELWYGGEPVKTDAMSWEVLGVQEDAVLKVQWFSFVRPTLESSSRSQAPR